MYALLLAVLMTGQVSKSDFKVVGSALTTKSISSVFRVVGENSPPVTKEPIVKHQEPAQVSRPEQVLVTHPVQYAPPMQYYSPRTSMSHYYTQPSTGGSYCPTGTCPRR